jgi:sec-independent protein translocase protein TatA
MNIFGIGLPEMAVIAAIALLVFGPKRLPEMGKTLGKTLKGFQSASQEFEKEFRQVIDPEPTVSAASVAESPISALPPPSETVVTAPAVPATPLSVSTEAD